METTVKIKYIKQSATKVRFVLKLVKGMQVDRALNKLDVANKKAAITISKAIRSGISNLMNNSENFNQKNLSENIERHYTFIPTLQETCDTTRLKTICNPRKMYIK